MNPLRSGHQKAPFGEIDRMAKFPWCRKTRLRPDLWPSVWSTRRSGLPACRSWSGPRRQHGVLRCPRPNMWTGNTQIWLGNQSAHSGKSDTLMRRLLAVLICRKAERRGFSLASVLLAAIPAVAADCCGWAVTSGKTASCLVQKNPLFHISRGSNLNYVRNIKYVSKKRANCTINGYLKKGRASFKLNTNLS